MKLRILSIVCFLFVIGLNAQTKVSIISLHDNDANGIPKDTNTVFQVKGVVTTVKELGNSSGTGSIQDATGGMTIYGSKFTAFSPALQIGDTVIVNSRLKNYNGLTEMDLTIATTPASSVTRVASGVGPEPQLLTIADLINQQWNLNEPYESKLIRLNNVTFVETGNFTTGTTGKTYNISDGTNSFQYRIFTNATTINNLPIPVGKCDVIGILTQYKVGAPYSTGYQLVGRVLADIISDGRPLVYSNMIVNNIDTSSFNIVFTTARNGNGQIKYGTDAANLIDSIVVASDTTVHNIKISGLKPSTLYYFQAISTNSAGTSTSAIQQVTTASGNPALGAINVYFSGTVDTTVAMKGNAAKGNSNFESLLINRINQATTSIDFAVYSMNGYPNLVAALLSAKSRGVKIRMVYDSRSGSAAQANVTSLTAGGVLMSQRPASLSGIMHNKFFVFDARDSNPANDWVWTGSWNPNTAELTWKNNVLEINDPALAVAYTTEFEEMWGSNTDTPNPTNAKFSTKKTDNTPHAFTIGGRSIQMYFSPSDKTDSRIKTAISQANTSIYFSLLVFTMNDLAQQIQTQYNAGVRDIKGVINDYTTTGSEYTFLKTYGDVLGNVGETQHNKYGLIDAYATASHPTVITGSHNWSSAAENENDENTLLIDDSKIANLYMQEFKARYNDAGGTGVFIVPSGIKEEQSLKAFSVNLYQNFPNPFNPTTTIRFETSVTQNIKVELFNLLGQKISELYNNTAKPGVYAIDLNASALNLTSGVYYYKIQTSTYSESKKMILLK